jgi:hypothetical protein
MKAAKLKAYIASVVTNRVFVFLIVGAALAWLTYRRFPLYINEPNFYAEDGSVFAQNIMQHGFLSALLTPFMGYFIVGLYMLEGLGFAVNSIFLGGNILNLPLAFAVVSHAFWAGVSCLPILLFWRDIKHKSYLILISIALVLVQLPSFNYAILGTIGNYKFAFLFIAFLLLVKRHMLPEKSKLFYAIDALLVVCAFTNMTVYLLLPFALLRYWPKRKKLDMAFVLRLLQNRSFISLVVMGLLVVVQIVYILLHGGVTVSKGYMDEPFEHQKTIELFVQRTFLFPFTYIASKHLNDVIVVILFLAALWGLWKVTRKDDRPILFFGLYSAFVGTALFVSQRPGVTRFFSNYQTSGTDQFFYAQNWIFLFIVLFMVARAMERKVGVRWRIMTVLVLIASPVCVLAHNDFGRGMTSQRATGALWYNAQVICSRPHGSSLGLPEYPGGVMAFQVSGSVCDQQVANYTPARAAMPLAPQGNNYVTINGEKTVAQTFTASYNQLSGVSLFVSTFTQTGHGTFGLDVMDASCTQTIRHSEFDATDIADGSYKDIHVAPIPDSKGKQYCFRVTPVRLEPGKPAIAIQLSPPSDKVGGWAIQDGSQLSQDVVFDVLYR